MPDNGVPTPNIRRLRGYSFDPSLSVQLETALVRRLRIYAQCSLTTSLAFLSLRKPTNFECRK